VKDGAKILDFSRTMAAAAAPQQSQPWPLYDLFLDLPHPAASKSCPGPFLIASPVQPNPVADEMQSILPQIARFAFPEYDESTQQQQAEQKDLNRYDVYAMQNESFLQFTFSLQLQTGSRLHGHVRRYLPPHLTARTRYDVGRRGERALVVLTRATGADLLYASILKYVLLSYSNEALFTTCTKKLTHSLTPSRTHTDPWKPSPRSRRHFLQQATCRMEAIPSSGFCTNCLATSST
jgi:hypothetical protein